MLFLDILIDTIKPKNDICFHEIFISKKLNRLNFYFRSQNRIFATLL